MQSNRSYLPLKDLRKLHRDLMTRTHSRAELESMMEAVPQLLQIAGEAVRLCREHPPVFDDLTEPSLKRLRRLVAHKGNEAK